MYPRSGDAQKTYGGADSETKKNLFDEFWEAYPGPRKVDKKKCRAKYDAIMKKARDAGKLHVAVMAGLAAWKRSRMWTEDGGRFVKAPLTWLNGECWNDAPASDPADAEAARKDREAEAERRIVEELRSKGLMA
jgi:hypothetical protein